MQQKPWLTAALYSVVLCSGILLWQTWKTESHKRTVVNHTQQSNIVSATHNDMGYHASNTNLNIPQGRTVHVKTDTLDLVIDRLGGNVISAKLLQYDAELNSGEPVTLLNSNDEVSRSMQSGITAKKPFLFNTSDSSFTLQPGMDKLVVSLYANDNGISVKKTYSFERGKYSLRVDDTILNSSNNVWEGSFYNQIKQQELNESSGFMQMRTFTGFSYSLQGKPYNKLSFSDLKDQAIRKYTKNSWIASQQHYFITAWVPPKGKKYIVSAAPMKNSDKYVIRMLSMPMSIAPNQTYTASNIMYIGPEKAKDLEKLSKGLGLTIDYGWLWFISNVLFILLDKIHTLIPNWGVAIILLTLLIKLAFYRLSAKSFQSMAQMKELQPKIEEIKQKHGDDKEALGKATMELYKKEKLNPLGGCLPMLIQIPFFIALYWVLMESVELRHAPFFGWIQDLSAKDPYFILPILMGLSMLWQQRLTPNQDPQQAKAMMVMPIMFTLLFLSFPSGLVLYWLVNNLLSIAQMWYCTKNTR